MRSREKPLIFVVDDEEIIASTITTILCLKGLDAIAFTRSSVALEYSHTVSPDLLICDVMMPELSGAALASHIQANFSACKVLLFTGQWELADTEIAAFGKGLVYQLMSKPVHPKELLKKVREMLDGALVTPANGEGQARIRTVKNMKETLAAVQADIATTTARKRSARRRAAHKS